MGVFVVNSVTHQGCRCCVLSGLVLRRLYPGLQVSRRMEVFALVSAAAPFDVVHAHDDRVLAAVHHPGLHRVSVAAVALAPRAVTALEFSADLAKGNIRNVVMGIHKWNIFSVQTEDRRCIGLVAK